MTTANTPKVLTPEEQEDHKEHIRRVNGIFALEGIEPGAATLAADRAVLAGVGTYRESVQELLAYVKEHQTLDGFVYSKAVGL